MKTIHGICRHAEIYSFGIYCDPIRSLSPCSFALLHFYIFFSCIIECFYFQLPLVKGTYVILFAVTFLQNNVKSFCETFRKC